MTRILCLHTDMMTLGGHSEDTLSFGSYKNDDLFFDDDFWGKSKVFFSDPVNSPSHYTQGDIECFDAMRAAAGDEAVKNYCSLACFKYMWRYRHKNGVEDLKKCQWYLNKLIELSKVD